MVIPLGPAPQWDQPCQEMATRGHTTRFLTRFPAQGPVLFCRVMMIPSAADKIPRKKTNAPTFPDHALSTLGNACSKFLITVSPERRFSEEDEDFQNKNLDY